MGEREFDVEVKPGAKAPTVLPSAPVVQTPRTDAAGLYIARAVQAPRPSLGTPQVAKTVAPRVVNRAAEPGVVSTVAKLAVKASKTAAGKAAIALAGVEGVEAIGNKAVPPTHPALAGLDFGDTLGRGIVHLPGNIIDRFGTAAAIVTGKRSQADYNAIPPALDAGRLDSDTGNIFGGDDKRVDSPLKQIGRDAVGFGAAVAAFPGGLASPLVDPIEDLLLGAGTAVVPESVTDAGKDLVARIKGKRGGDVVREPGSFGEARFAPSPTSVVDRLDSARLRALAKLGDGTTKGAPKRQDPDGIRGVAGPDDVPYPADQQKPAGYGVRGAHEPPTPLRDLQSSVRFPPMAESSDARSALGLPPRGVPLTAEQAQRVKAYERTRNAAQNTTGHSSFWTSGKPGETRGRIGAVVATRAAVHDVQGPPSPTPAPAPAGAPSGVMPVVQQTLSPPSTLIVQGDRTMSPVPTSVIGAANKVVDAARANPTGTLLVGAATGIVGGGAVAAAVAHARSHPKKKKAKHSSRHRSSRSSSSSRRKTSRHGKKQRRATTRPKKGKREDRGGVTRSTYRGQRVYSYKGRKYVIRQRKEGKLAKGTWKFIPQ